MLFRSKYRKLIELLNIKTLIITDLDYEKSALTPNEIGRSHTTNATINNFYNDKKTGNPTVTQLYGWADAKENILLHNLIYVAFQTAQDSYARTLEEAMLGKYFGFNVDHKLKHSEWEKKRKGSKLQFYIPKNNKGETDSEFTLRDILKATSGNKTDFMYSVILNNLTLQMEPQYISEGLKWLME